MNVKPYAISYDSKRVTFGFQSVSNRQTIEKIVLFSPIVETAAVFNLALCDLDENGELRDDIVSNNDDLEKVMATMIIIIGLFFEANPDKKVFFEGNSPARTRLYQIAINKIFDNHSLLKVLPKIKLSLSKEIRIIPLSLYQKNQYYDGHKYRKIKQRRLEDF